MPALRNQYDLEAASMLQKFFMVVRYFYKQLSLHGRLKMKGFVYFERDVTIKISPGARVEIEPHVYLKKGVVIECSQQGYICIGEGSVIGFYSWLGSIRRVEIGKKCLIGSYVTIFDAAHMVDPDRCIADSGYHEGETIIGDDCMIGTKATVGANVKVGNGSVVGANAVLSRDLPGMVIAVGVPARVIRERS